VDAQEVDFNKMMSLVVNSDGSRDSADEAYHLIGLRRSYSAMPLFKPTYFKIIIHCKVIAYKIGIVTKI